MLLERTCYLGLISVVRSMSEMGIFRQQLSVRHAALALRSCERESSPAWLAREHNVVVIREFSQTIF